LPLFDAGRSSAHYQAGEAMFRVFVQRDEKREMLVDQVTRFEVLSARVVAGS
jgi:putative heme iron utilization protein